MFLKGEISSVEGNKCKVFIRERNYLTNLIDIADHITTVKVNDKVVVAFYDGGLLEGMVIAKVKVE